MKKVLALVLALVLVLSLAACGEGSGGEKPHNLDAENAIVETPVHIYDDAMENLAKVKKNTYIMDCLVDKITDSYIECGNLIIYLSEDELANLNRGDEVAIIGKVTECKEEIYLVFGEAELYDGTVPEVAPRDSEIFTGILKRERKDQGFEGAWDIEYKGSNYHKLIHFADGEDTSSLKSGDKITFSAYATFTPDDPDDPDEFFDAKIIKIE